MGTTDGPRLALAPAPGEELESDPFPCPPPGPRWWTEVLGGQLMRRTTNRSREYPPHGFAWWTEDGLVIEVSGPEADLEAVIEGVLATR